MDAALIPRWLQAIVLGCLQGITEFLPVSSSAHLVLIPYVSDWEYLGKGFDVALHGGTLAAVMIFFRRELGWLLQGTCDLLKERRIGDNPARALVLKLIWASIPVAVVGFIIRNYVAELFNDIGYIAVMLIVFGLILGIADQLGDKTRSIESLSYKETLWIGVAQALALMPGVSRSGVTISAALLLGLSRREAARFSFLLALPAIGGACLLKLISYWNSYWNSYLMVRDGVDVYLQSELLWVYIWGVLSAFLSGLGAMKYLLVYLEERDFTPFVWYRLVLGGVFLVFVYLVAWQYPGN